MEEQNTPQQNPNSPTNQQNTLIIILLVILVLLTSGVAGYSFYQNNQLKKQIAQLKAQTEQEPFPSRQQPPSPEPELLVDSVSIPPSNPTEIQVRGIAHRYLEAYVNKNWETVKELCHDPKFDENIAESYELTDYKILNTKQANDPQYYHVYISLTNKKGETFTEATPDGPKLALLMIKKDGGWKTLTWYFFS